MKSLRERGGRIQGQRGQEGPQTLSLVRNKSHHQDPGTARGAGGKPGECAVHRPRGFKEEGGTDCVWGC